jgi:hypothetical protein
MFEKGVFDPEELRIFHGELENTGIESANNNGTNVVVAFNQNTPDGMGANDVAVCVIADENGENVRCATGKRSAGTVNVSLATVPNAASLDFHAYLAFARPPAKKTGEQGMVSTTSCRAVA